jgi:hypothetical protein
LSFSVFAKRTTRTLRWIGITQSGTDLERVKVKAKSLFETLNMPQKPDGLRILDQDGDEVFFWTPGADDA